MTNTLDVLKARASVKEYDTNAPISKEELTELLTLPLKRLQLGTFSIGISLYSTVMNQKRRFFL